MPAELPRRRPDWPQLRARLDALAETFGPEHVSPDPLEVVRRYRDRDDLEVAGFVGAALAFGSARGAVRATEALLARLDGPPGAVVRAWDAARDAARLRGWRHRWLGEGDAAAALHVVGRMMREHGSVEAFFAAGDDHGADVGGALGSFCARALALAPPRAPSRLAYWLAGPAKGGSAKRLCLFLRWMCRRDRIDPGPWTAVDPARLVVPLDVHVARIARFTGLLRRRSAGWKSALEVTANLRRFDPRDPVRYDFAICRLGILGTCPRRRHLRKCAACPLYDVCLL
jgi:uncharacterized protein (TIGR02757 family)